MNIEIPSHMKTGRLSIVCLVAGMQGMLCLCHAAGPVVKPATAAPVMFNTAEADRILSGLKVFPPDTRGTGHIETAAAANSAAMIAAIGADKKLACNLDMGFILVPGNQARVPVKIRLYPNESDPGPFPLPDSAPVEDGRWTVGRWPSPRRRRSRVTGM